MGCRGEIGERDNSTSAAAIRLQHGGRLPALWLIALLGYLALTASGTVSGRNAVWLDGAIWTFAAGLAATAAWRTSRLLAGAQRLAWRLFAIGCLIGLAGQLIRDWNELVRGISVPLPAIGGIGYVGFSLAIVVGLLLLRHGLGTSTRTPQRLANLGLIVCSFAVVLVALVLHPISHTQHTTWFAAVVLVESLCVLSAFTVAVYFLWSYRWGRQLPVALLVSFGLLAHSISFLVHAHQWILDQVGAANLINTGWLAAFGFQHWAASVEAGAASNRSSASELAVKGEGWVEALMPGMLLLLVALTLIPLIAALSPLAIVTIAVLLTVFASILTFREAWMYSRGQQLRARLHTSNVELEELHAELRKTEEQRVRLERDIEFTTRAGAVGLWDWDMVTDSVRFSKEWKRQLGYEDHEVANDTSEWRRRVHPDDDSRIRAVVEECMDGKPHEFKMEFRLQHRDGSYRWILSHATLMVDDSGRQIRMLGSHVDITKSKEIEVALRESEARYRELADALELRVAQRTADLTEAYRESRSFAYAVAHDLKAPLRAIDSFSHFVQESAQSRLTDTEIGYLARVRRGAIHMSTLIEGLLDYSRMEHLEVRIEPLLLNAFVADLLATLQDEMGRSSVEVTTDLPPITICADREGLAVVLRNLLENALKFTRGCSSPSIQIGARDQDRKALLWVRDNGIGFEQIYHEKIFDIFQRLHRSDEYEGTGIGLALVRKAMQRMKGRIWAIAAPNEGATFYLELPLAQADQ